jgi:hypothetical protein
MQGLKPVPETPHWPISGFARLARADPRLDPLKMRPPASQALTGPRSWKISGLPDCLARLLGNRVGMRRQRASGLLPSIRDQRCAHFVWCQCRLIGEALMPPLPGGGNPGRSGRSRQFRERYCQRVDSRLIEAGGLQPGNGGVSPNVAAILLEFSCQYGCRRSDCNKPRPYFAPGWGLLSGCIIATDPGDAIISTSHAGAGASPAMYAAACSIASHCRFALTRDQPARATIGTTVEIASPPCRAVVNKRPHNSIARTCSGQRLDR